MATGVFHAGAKGIERKMVETRSRIRGVGVLGGRRGPKERVGIVMENNASVWQLKGDDTEVVTAKLARRPVQEEGDQQMCFGDVLCNVWRRAVPHSDGVAMQ